MFQGFRRLNRANIVSPEVIKADLPQGTPISYGVSEAGIDLRISQAVSVEPEFDDATGFPVLSPFQNDFLPVPVQSDSNGSYVSLLPGTVYLCPSVERITCPADMVAIPLIKSTYGRLGLSVAAALVEPGWEGHFTATIVNHGLIPVRVYLDYGVFQLVFAEAQGTVDYAGKYQNAGPDPQPSTVFGAGADEEDQEGTSGLAYLGQEISRRAQRRLRRVVRRRSLFPQTIRTRKEELIVDRSDVEGQYTLVWVDESGSPAPESLTVFTYDADSDEFTVVNSGSGVDIPNAGSL